MFILEVIVTILHIASGSWEGRAVIEEVQADVERGDYVSASQRMAEYTVHEAAGSDPNVALAEALRKLTELLLEEAHKQKQAESESTSTDALASNEVVDVSLSEDGNWGWTASLGDWVANDSSTSTAQYSDDAQYADNASYSDNTSMVDGSLSEDGQWRWNASLGDWVANDSSTSTAQYSDDAQYADNASYSDNSVADGSLSEDGQWRWDATAQEWAAASG
jgi:hypothetical protein